MIDLSKKALGNVSYNLTDLGDQLSLSDRFKGGIKSSRLAARAHAYAKNTFCDDRGFVPSLTFLPDARLTITRLKTA